MARLHTGRHKVMAAYRSYHGATAGAIALTGDPRRWPSEPGMPGIVRYWGPYPYRSAFHAAGPSRRRASARCSTCATSIMVEGPQTIAAIILETVVGTNGILVPPPGYLQGVRDICDEFGIVMIADEVMAGFARCGEWFAVDHWGVAPDLITFAKGVNSGYVPAGRRDHLRPRSPQTFDQRPFPGGLTYSGHPLACASAVASINIFKEEGIVEHARVARRRTSSARACATWPSATPASARSAGSVSSGRSSWSATGHTREPLVPFNAAGADAKPMNDFAAACKERGLWPFIHFNRTHVVPPCTTTADEVREGLAILDEALTVADAFYTGADA